MVDYLLKLFNDSIWMTNERNLRLMTAVLANKLNSDSKLFEKELLDMTVKAGKKAEPQIDGSTAYLPIVGQLVPKCSQLDALCGFASTFELHDQFLEFSNNPRIETILLDFDSPGGAMPGGFEFAQSVKDSEKKVISFTQTQMTSLAYLIASGSTIYATPTASVGSIGVYASIIKEKENDRYETYVFKAGDEKAMGHPNTGMSDTERNYFQSRIDETYSMFVDIVSEFRGLDRQTVLDSKGGSNIAMRMQNYVDKIITKEDFLKGVMNGSI